MKEYRLKVNLNLNTISLEDSKALIKMLEERIKNEEESNEKEGEEKGEAVTYDAIMKQFYNNNEKVLYPTSVGNDGISVLNTKTSIIIDDYLDWDNCMTKKQAKRIQAFNKLQNIAKYLNNGLEPDFTSWFSSSQAYVIVKGESISYVPIRTFCNEGGIYFQTEEKAKKAIEIMGKESLDDLFCTDW